MKNLVYILIFCLFAYSCNSSKKTIVTNNSKDIAITKQDTVRIANDEIEYEIVIIEPGFNFWLNSTAKPKGYYSKEFLESRNAILVQEWNARVLQPQRFSTNLYEFRIDYNQNTDYGYKVNYILYNYFVYFQIKYKQRLSGFVPRI